MSMMRLLIKKSSQDAGLSLKGAKAAKRQQCYMSLNGMDFVHRIRLAHRDSARHDVFFHEVWAVAARRPAETKFA